MALMKMPCAVGSGGSAATINNTFSWTNDTWVDTGIKATDVSFFVIVFNNISFAGIVAELSGGTITRVVYTSSGSISMRVGTTGNIEVYQALTGNYSSTLIAG